MTPDEQQLVTDLKRVLSQVPQFVLEFTAGDLPVEAEKAYAYRLVDVAEELLRHARNRVSAGAAQRAALITILRTGEKGDG